MNFIENIKEKAKKNKKTIVLPEANDIRTLEAAHKILEQDLANVILIGDTEEFAEGAENFDLSKATIINPLTKEDLDDYIVAFYELRKRKGMTLDESRRVLTSNRLFFGVMMVKLGEADGMVAGCCNSTANVLRPSLQILKTKPGVELVSSFMVMEIPDTPYGLNGQFVFSDCGLVQNPTSEELAAIANNAARGFRILLEDEPVVALLSHSTMGSARHADVDKVVTAVEIAKEKFPDLILDGEFQLDTAIVPEVGAMKVPGNKVAGHANCIIFPDLDAGNIGYKLVHRFAKAEAYGPITQGIAKPVNDLSRGCSADDIVGVVAITAVQAQLEEEEKKEN